MTRKANRKSPFDVLSDSLHSIDLIFNSKREDLVKRLREGNAAWEQRKKHYSGDRLLQERDSAEKPTDQCPKRARRGPARDADYPSPLAVSELLQQADSGLRGEEVGLKDHSALIKLNQSAMYPTVPLLCTEAHSRIIRLGKIRIYPTQGCPYATSGKHVDANAIKTSLSC